MSHSAVNDATFFKAHAGSLQARKEAPSRQRKYFGLLFDKLDVKFLGKPILECMLSDWPGSEYSCVPICLDDNLEPYV